MYVSVRVWRSVHTVSDSDMPSRSSLADQMAEMTLSGWLNFVSSASSSSMPSTTPALRRT